MEDIIKKTITITPVESTPEIDRLKEIRNGYYDKINEIQKEIDNKFLELHKVPDFSGKWVKFSKNNGCYVGLVSETFRLVNSFKLCFQEVYIERDKHITFWQDYDSGINFSWDDVITIDEISQQEAIDIIYNSFTKVIKKYEDTKTE